MCAALENASYSFWRFSLFFFSLLLLSDRLFSLFFVLFLFVFKPLGFSTFNTKELCTNKTRSPRPLHCHLPPEWSRTKGDKIINIFSELPNVKYSIKKRDFSFEISHNVWCNILISRKNISKYRQNEPQICDIKYSAKAAYKKICTHKFSK